MILVTGGAGFIGSVLTWRLLDQGAEVAVVDHRDLVDRAGNLQGARLRDWISPQEWLDRIAGGGPAPAIEAVFHLGACSSTTETDAAFLRRNNFEYSRLVAQWCLARGIRFLYASTAATYGDGAQGYDDDPARLDRLRPLNLYAHSKHDFDLWARDQGALDRVVGLKYFNVFGPNEYHKGHMRSMVLKAWERIEAGVPVELFRSHKPEFADGEQVRDFLYVEDAVRMTLWFHGQPAVSGIFNIGSGVARSWNALAAAVYAAAGRTPDIRYVDMPEGIRAAYQYHTCADLSRLRRAGCDVSPLPLEEAVAAYVRRYLAGGPRFATEAR